MQSRRRTQEVALLVAMIATISARRALAQSPSSDDIYESGPSESARESFEKAIALTKANKIAEALALFQRAYDERPNWKILYNIGVCSKYVGDHARSLKAFQRYLSEGHDIGSARRAEVEGEIRDLSLLVGRIDVASAATGTAIAIDGVIEGKTPLAAPLVANAGRHELRATKEGAPPIVRDVVVPIGGTVAVALVVPSSAPPSSTVIEPPRAPAAPDAKTPAQSRSSSWIVAGWVATGAFAVGAGVTGVLALTTSKDLAASSYSGSTPPPDLQSKAARVDTLAVLTDVLAGAAVATAAISIYLMVKAPSASTPPKAAFQSAWSPRLGLGRGGVTLGSSF